MITVLVCALAGLGAGIATGFGGLSAAVFITPMLVTFLDISAFDAISIALASDVLASAVSSATYFRHGNINIKKSLPLLIIVLLFTVIGSVASYFFTSTSMGDTALSYWTIVVSLAIGAKFLLKPVKRELSSEKPKKYTLLLTALVGIYIGFVCGFQGTGGGMMLLFALAVVLGYSLKSAVGTSVFIMTFTALIGAATHFVISGVPDFLPLAVCVVSTLVGAQAAAVAANRIKTVNCSLVIGVLLTASAVLMLAVAAAEVAAGWVRVLVWSAFAAALAVIAAILAVQFIKYNRGKTMKKYKVKRAGFHKFVWKAGRVFVRPYMKKHYSFITDKMPKIKENYLVISNHTTEVDYFMAGLAFPRQMYFVAGEHLMATKAYPKVDYFFNPIPMYKGDADTTSVREILRRLHAGYNVLIYAEGSRSFNGETLELPDSIGRMCKMAKCAVVTYRTAGGYFCEPRWAYSKRYGHMEGKVVNVYSGADVAKMTVAEITEAVNKDIYMNAYDEQKKRMHEYNGERLAEGLENYLLICPECGAYDSMETKDNKFKCRCCGKGGEYTVQGFLKGDVKFDSVYDWGKWQEGRFAEDMQGKQPDELLFEEKGVRMYEIEENHERKTLAEGALKIYIDRFNFNGADYAFSEIKGLSMLYYGKTLLITYGGKHYGFTGEGFHALKIQWLYEKHERERSAGVHRSEK